VFYVQVFYELLQRINARKAAGSQDSGKDESGTKKCCILM
jgi:hypothetical protein